MRHTMPNHEAKGPFVSPKEILLRLRRRHGGGCAAGGCGCLCDGNVGGKAALGSGAKNMGPDVAAYDED